jgi:hypothetical protein
MNTFAKLTDICVGFLVIALIAVAVNPLLPQKYQSSVISSAFGYGFPDADFSVSCTPASSSVYQGDDAYFSLGTTAIGEFTEPVTWVVTDVSPVNAEMPVISVISNDQVPSYVSQLLAETTLATSPGTYTISLDAQASSVTRTCSVELVVEEPLPTPDYSVSCSLANPATITVGETSVVTLSTVGINGFSNAVTWTVNDVSPYMTSQPEYLFNDNNLVPDADTTVYISTDENTSTGTFTFVFGASDGDIPRTCTAELTINAVSVSPPVFTGGGGSGSSLPPVSVTPPVSSAPPTVSEGGASCVDAVATASLKPLYRLWNPRITNHFYTTDSAERGAALKAG